MYQLRGKRRSTGLKTAITGILAAQLFFLSLASCSTIKEIPVETRIVTVYRDSLVCRDSVVVVPVERVVDVTPVLDTLVMETSMAISKSYLDTSMNILKGSLVNKKEIIYKTIEKERLVYQKDTIEKEVPVIQKDTIEKEVIPKSYWYLLGYALFTMAAAGAYLYFKFFKKLP